MTSVIFPPSHSPKTWTFIRKPLRFTSEGILNVSQKMSDESPHSDTNTQPQGSPVPTSTLYFVFRHGTKPAEVNYRRWYLHQQVFCWFITAISVRQRDLHNTPRATYKLCWNHVPLPFFRGSSQFIQKSRRQEVHFDSKLRCQCSVAKHGKVRCIPLHSVQWQ